MYTPLNLNYAVCACVCMISRQFEGEHLKSHQELMNKGVELSGIITRLKSQLAHERQSTTASSESIT